jgi:hypothetical protein
MQTFHNPDRFMSDLRQVLSQGRKRIGLLVGAGAPLSIRIDANGRLDPTGKPLMPGVDELTRTALDELTDTHKSAAAAIRAELGSGANIETILSRIRLLNQALGSTKVHGLDANGYKELGTAICKKIGEIVGAELPKERNAFTEFVAWVSAPIQY